jgi:hypothetical protein
MPIQFHCSHCQQSFPVASQFRDDPTCCPNCKEHTLAAVLVPAAGDPRKSTMVERKTKVTRKVPVAKPALPKEKESPAVAAPTIVPEVELVPVLPPAAPSLAHWRTIAAASAAAALVTLGLTLSLGSRKHVPVAVTPTEEIQQVAAAEPMKIVEPTPPAPVAEEKPAPVVEPAAVEAPAEQQKTEPAVAAPAEKKTVEGDAEKQAERQPLIIKRRSSKSDEELRRELVLVSEMSLYQIPAASRKTLTEAPKTRKILPEEMPDFAGLPMRMGVDCQLGKDYADSLQVLSRKLRTYMAAASSQDQNDTRLDANALRKQLLGGISPERVDKRMAAAFRRNGADPAKDAERGIWSQAEAVPTLTQMLMPESRPARLLLIDLLANIPDTRATVALAQRALYDLSSDVRAAAIQALRDRPREEFEPILLGGMRYPWAPVADHAAEALVALQDKEAVTKLVALLREPDPSGTFRDSQDRVMVREMVRINHLSNCTMCHATAVATTDPVRGRVPSPSEPLPPPVQYYDAPGGVFVRADVTYLQQDFSVPQPVTNHGPWPRDQRYDYMVRTRPANKAEKDAARVRGLVDANPNYEQRESVLFALRELTGKDVGKSTENWQRLVAQKR